MGNLKWASNYMEGCYADGSRVVAANRTFLCNGMSIRYPEANVMSMHKLFTYVYSFDSFLPRVYLFYVVYL